MGRETMENVTAGIESVRPSPQISVVVPVYNEEEGLVHFKERLEKVLDTLLYEWEAVFVNDGSSDKSGEILKGFHLRNPRIKVISFSRNFVHQMAITAGTARTPLQSEADVHAREACFHSGWGESNRLEDINY